MSTQPDTAATGSDYESPQQAPVQPKTDDTQQHATNVTSPEHMVGNDPPPTPDYPRYRVEPGEQVRLADVDPNQTEDYEKKKDVRKELEKQSKRIGELQARLYAERKQSMLIVLQAMDTGGKDGTIKHVFEHVNPQGCQVWSFKAPSSEELEHDFLWRYHEKAPPQGMITIFNRSHYEDVLVVRVKNLVPEHVWRDRYQMINNFEHLLTLNNTVVVTDNRVIATGDDVVIVE